jgi:hypothetical protein
MQVLSVLVPRCNEPCYEFAMELSRKRSYPIQRGRGEERESKDEAQLRSLIRSVYFHAAHMASGYPYIDVFLLTGSISASWAGLRLPVWRLRRRSRALVLLWRPSGDVVVTFPPSCVSACPHAVENL